MSKKIKCQCKNCGNIWETRPYELVKGYGCNACAKKEIGKNKIQKAKVIFEAQISQKFPQIKILSEYQGKHRTIQVYCEDCKESYEILADRLSKLTMCPKCREKKFGKRNKRFKKESTQTERVRAKIKKAEEKFPNLSIQLINEDIEEVKIICLICGEERCSKLDNLLRSVGADIVAEEPLKNLAHIMRMLF